MGEPDKHLVSGNSNGPEFRGGKSDYVSFAPWSRRRNGSASAIVIKHYDPRH
jgi:hypothetical protein